jgi:hypothetical protein
MSPVYQRGGGRCRRDIPWISAGDPWAGFSDLATDTQALACQMKRFRARDTDIPLPSPRATCVMWISSRRDSCNSCIRRSRFRETISLIISFSLYLPAASQWRQTRLRSHWRGGGVVFQVHWNLAFHFNQEANLITHGNCTNFSGFRCSHLAGWLSAGSLTFRLFLWTKLLSYLHLLTRTPRCESWKYKRKGGFHASWIAYLMPLTSAFRRDHKFWFGDPKLRFQSQSASI